MRDNLSETKGVFPLGFDDEHERWQGKMKQAGVEELIPLRNGKTRHPSARRDWRLVDQMAGTTRQPRPSCAGS